MSLFDVMKAERELRAIKEKAGGPRVELDYDGKVKVRLVPSAYSVRGEMVRVFNAEGEELVSVNTAGLTRVPTGKAIVGLDNEVDVDDGHIRVRSYSGGWSDRWEVKVGPDGGVSVSRGGGGFSLGVDGRMVAVSAGGRHILVQEPDGTHYSAPFLSLPRRESYRGQECIRQDMDRNPLQPGDLVEFSVSGEAGSTRVGRVLDQLAAGPNVRYYRWAYERLYDVDPSDPGVLRLGRERPAVEIEAEALHEVESEIPYVYEQDDLGDYEPPEFDLEVNPEPLPEPEIEEPMSTMGEMLALKRKRMREARADNL